jgi:hypothetical protein
MSMAFAAPLAGSPLTSMFEGMGGYVIDWSREGYPVKSTHQQWSAAKIKRLSQVSSPCIGLPGTVKNSAQ